MNRAGDGTAHAVRRGGADAGNLRPGGAARGLAASRRSPAQTPCRHRTACEPDAPRERFHREPSWRRACIPRSIDPPCRRRLRAWCWPRPAGDRAPRGASPRRPDRSGPCPRPAARAPPNSAVELERPCPVGLAVRHERRAHGIHGHQRTDDETLAEIERGGADAAFDAGPPCAPRPAPPSRARNPRRPPRRRAMPRSR